MVKRFLVFFPATDLIFLSFLSFFFFFFFPPPCFWGVHLCLFAFIYVSVMAPTTETMRAFVGIWDDMTQSMLSVMDCNSDA